MTESISKSIRRIGKGKNTEFEQALSRLVIGVLCLIYISYLWTRTLGADSIVLMAISLAVPFLLASLFLLGWVITSPDGPHYRRVLASTVDIVTLSVVFYILGNDAVLLYWIFLWIIIGNGFRFGVRNLTITAILSAIGFLVATSSPRWTIDENITRLLFGTLIILPLFAALLLKRLLSRHQYLQHQYALVKHQATRDQLTGIANRSVFQANIESALARFRRYEIGFVVAFIDLDGFKGINDTYGHVMADKLLGSVADKLVGIVRECDTVARMGGDEFALILSDFRCGSLDTLSRKVRDALSSAHRVDGSMILCNASIGFACCPVDGTDMETLVTRADLRMYSQKNDRHLILGNNASPDPEPAS